MEAKSWFQKNKFFTCPDRPMPTFARAHPKILKNSSLFFFNLELLKTHHGRQKYYFFFHGTF
jgi:hypothetical protein